jgi:predicted nicotinamide N-methyase
MSNLENDDESWLLALDPDLFTQENGERIQNNLRKTRCVLERGWTPTFKDQMDLGIRSYTLRACGCACVVSLEHRDNGTGSDMWDSAVVVAHYFDQLMKKGNDSSFLRGRTVVELGSGVGALGILVSKLGVEKCFLTDLPDCCNLLRRNIALNHDNRGENHSAAAEGIEMGIRESTQVAEVVALEWGQPIPMRIREWLTKLTSEHHNFGESGLVVLASDLLLPFAPELFRPLSETLAALLRLGPTGNESSYAILAYEERFDCSKFFVEVAACGMITTRIPDDDLSPVYRDPGRIHVVRLVLQ